MDDCECAEANMLGSGQKRIQDPEEVQRQPGRRDSTGPQPGPTETRPIRRGHTAMISAMMAGHKLGPDLRHPGRSHGSGGSRRECGVLAQDGNLWNTGATTVSRYAMGLQIRMYILRLLWPRGQT